MYKMNLFCIKFGVELRYNSLYRLEIYGWDGGISNLLIFIVAQCRTKSDKYFFMYKKKLVIQWSIIKG